MKTKKFLLPESEIPTDFFNIQAIMPNKPVPILNPGTREPMKAEDLYPIFCEECARQEMDTVHEYIPIPEEVREKYAFYRCTPLVRAYGLEKALDTPAHIYFKNESVSPAGSHKLNSAIAQAYYCKQQGITNITTETGAGQWGGALSYAASMFGLDCAVYMVKVSYEQKPYRRTIMGVFGSTPIASPSMSTRAGKDIITANPTDSGSLGTAISEAIELAINTPNCKYTLGSVLNHVCLHQTVIGQEAKKQMEMAGEEPDIVRSWAAARPGSSQLNPNHARSSPGASSNMTSATWPATLPSWECTPSDTSSIPRTSTQAASATTAPAPSWPS